MDIQELYNYTIQQYNQAIEIRDQLIFNIENITNYQGPLTQEDQLVILSNDLSRIVGLLEAYSDVISYISHSTRTVNQLHIN